MWHYRNLFLYAEWNLWHGHEDKVSHRLEALQRVRLHRGPVPGPHVRPLAKRSREEHPHEDDLRRPPRGRRIPSEHAVHQDGRRLRRRRGPGHPEVPGRDAGADEEERRGRRPDARRHGLDLRLPLHPAGEAGHEEGRRPPGPHARGLRPGAGRAHKVRQGAQGAPPAPPRRRPRDDRRRPGVLVQGSEGQARLREGRRLRAGHTVGEEVPAVQVRHRQGQGGVRGAGLLHRRLHRQELHPGRVHNHIQGHSQRDLPEQEGGRLRDREDRRVHEQRDRAPAPEAVVRGEADPDHVLRPALPRAPGLRGDHRRARNLAPRVLAAEDRRLPPQHLQGARHPDDRRHPLPPDRARQVGQGKGAEAGRCAST